MHYQVTVRYGGSRQRYHTYTLEAPNAQVALAMASEEMPDEIVPHADLVELRVTVAPEERVYMEEPAP